MGKAGRMLVYAAWEGRAAALGRLLRRMAAGLARELRTGPSVASQ